MRRSTRIALAGLGVLCAAGCVRSPVAAVPPPLAHVEPSDVEPGEAALPWREDAPGTVVLFVRNVMSKRVQETGRAMADGFVDECEPPYDAIAVVDPGVAIAWPGIEERAKEKLATRRAWRAACLSMHGAAGESASLQAERQVKLVLDEGAWIRARVLADADPGGDIVVAAFGPHGRALYRSEVAVDADYERRSAIVADAIDAIRRATLD